MDNLNFGAEYLEDGSLEVPVYAGTDTPLGCFRSSRGFLVCHRAF